MCRPHDGDGGDGAVGRCRQGLSSDGNLEREREGRATIRWIKRRWRGNYGRGKVRAASLNLCSAGGLGEAAIALFLYSCTGAQISEY